MAKHSPIAAAPRYMQTFRCVGDACPENCCTGWTVTVDKPTFQQYRSVKIEPLASLLREQVRRSSNGPAYATIRMRAEDEACPFLDAQRLCQIHGGLGEQALSRTCKDYPRQYSSDAGALGLHATLSCPEAARLALTDPAALDPVVLPLAFANEGLVPQHKTRAAAATGETDVLRRHAALVGQAVGELLRAEGLSAAEAMVVAGLMLRRIARITSQGDAAELELARAIHQFLAPEQLALAPGLVGGLVVSKPLQLDLLLHTTERFTSSSGGRPSFRLLINEVWQGLDCAAGLEAAALRLQDVERTHFRPFEAAHPHVLKNYLLNELGLALFPQQGLAQLEREFMAIAVRFALIKLYAIGLAAQRGSDFGEDDVVRAVYVVTRNISHHQRFMPDLLLKLEEQQALKLEVLATLLL
jgi:lysine-N-methylase